MVAGRSLKEVISRTKQAARNIRQSLEEIAQELTSQRHLQPEPLLARVPVNRSGTRHPFANKSYNRGFSTLGKQQSIRYASTFIRPNYVARNTFRQGSLKNIWSFNSFKQLNSIGGNTISKGIFPSTLYANFVKTNSRNYSSYTNFTQQAVRNLHQSIRAICLQGKDELQRRNYGFNNSPFYTQEVYKLAKTNSSFSEFMDNCVVDFNLNSVKYSIPTMTFMDDDVLTDLQYDFVKNGLHLKSVYEQISLIKDQFGSLPMSLEQNGSILRIHFTNCDSSKVELLLRDIGVTQGVIHEIRESSSSPLITSSSSSISITDLDNSILSMTDGDLSSYYISDANESDVLTEDFFPVMEMSDPVLIVDPLDPLNPVIV